MPNDVFKKIHVAPKTSANKQDVSKAMEGIASDLNRIQSQISDAFRLLQSQNALLQSNQITDIIGIGVGPYTAVISHGLGRTPIGWFVVDVTGSATTFYRSAWDDETLTLIVSTAQTFSVMVF